MNKNIEFKEFRVGDLFEQLRGKESSPNKVPDGPFNMINETTANNGIAKKGFSNNIFKAPAITVSVNFARNVFFQEEDFCASVNIIILKAPWLERYPKAGLYICSVLSKNNERYDYVNKISKEKLNNTIIKLPVTSSGEPDYKYMSELISELEQERISELEAYLEATGLDDYELTPEDIAVLQSELGGGTTKSKLRKLISSFGRVEKV